MILIITVRCSHTIQISNCSKIFVNQQKPMLEDPQASIAKSVVTFIDIILDLYSPVPHQIRNQMRVLQTTLLYSRKKQLEEYIASLREKLDLKEKNKHQRMLSDGMVPFSISEKSPLRKARNHLADSDKENKFYLNNLRTNTSQNLKSKENSFNISVGQMDKNRKISAVQYLNRQDQQVNEFKASKTVQIPRTASRTLLKIVKKSRSSKQKDPLTARTHEAFSKSSQLLRDSIGQILSIMNTNQTNLAFQGGKNRFQFD